MDFYEEYNSIREGIERGEFRPDELNDEGYLIYNYGSGKFKRDELNDDAIKFLDTNFGGGPSLMGDIKDTAASGWRTFQHGVRQNPILDAYSTAIATRNLQMDPTAPANARVQGRYDYDKDPLTAAVGLVKSAYNIPMGLLEAQGAPAHAATNALMRNTRIPDNILTRVPLEIGAGVVQDVATLNPLSILARGAGLISRSSNKIRTAKETVAAPASGIAFEAATGEKQIDPLAEAAKGVHVPTLYERALKLLTPKQEATPYRDAVRDLVEEAVDKDKKMINLGSKADKVLNYAQSEEFRAWSDEIMGALKEKGFSDEAVTAFLRARAKFMVDPGHTPTATELARTQVVRDITKLAEEDPNLANKLGILYKPKQPLGPDPQADLFGRTESPTPAHIRPTGPTTGTTWDETRVLPGQLEGKAIQMELALPAAEAEARRGAKLGQSVSNIMTGRNVDRVTQMKDPALGLRLNNLLRKSISGLVTGPGTAMRNFTNQTIRKGLEVPISVYEEILNGGSIDDALKSIGAQLGTVVDYRGAGDMMEMLSDAQKQRLKYKGMYGDTPPDSLPSFPILDKPVDLVFNWANKANAKIEEYAWLSAFKGHIDGWAAKAGMKDVRPGQVPGNVLDEAFERAMELTYSRDLPEGFKEGWEKALSTHYGPLPVGFLIQEAAPFARFSWANAFTDVLDMAPTGFYRALAADPKEAGRIMGKVAVGNKMLQVALAQKEVPSGEWYEMELPGLGKVDVRRWHPLDAYALVAEIIHRPMGTPNARVTKADLAQLIAGGNRLDDTILGTVIGMYMGESTQSIDRSLGQIAGSYLSRWTTPLKWGQLGQQVGNLAMTGTLGESGVQRDLNTGSYGLGGALDRPAANIPGLSEGLPARVDPSSPDTPGIKTFKELTTRLFGLDPIQTNRIKEELKRLKFTGPQGKDFGEHLADQLGIEDQRFKTGELDVPKAGDFLLKLYARTGDPQLNRVLNEHMAKMGTQALAAILDSPAYNTLSDPKRRLIMDEVIVGMKGAFKKAKASGFTPYQAIDNWLKAQSPSLRGLLDEMVKKDKNPYLKR